MERLRRATQPGFLIPALGAALVATDLVLLLALPLDRVSYRVWEAARTPGASAPFRPGVHYDRPRVYGNLAAIGNQLDLREYHRVVFTTDSLGYHNPPGLAASGDVAVLLFGSSFSAGTEVNDDEHFAPQLSRLIGRGVYNAAPDGAVPSVVLALARQLRLREGVVIYEHYEGRAPPPLLAAPPGVESVRCRFVLGPWSTPHRCAALSRWWLRVKHSPLNVFAARAHRIVRNDRWLPNDAAYRVARAPLTTGDDMLFHAVRRQGDVRPVEPMVEYGAWLAEQLAPHHLSVLVVLLPDKYTVYKPLLAVPAPEAANVPGAEYLARVERELRARGVPVVNLTEPLRQAARAALPSHRYIYWRDDTHWNVAGVRVAAEAVAPTLRRLLAQPRAAPVDSLVYRLTAASELDAYTEKAGLLGTLGHPHHVRARAFSGVIVHVPDDPARSRVTVTVAAESLEILTEASASDRAKMTRAMRDKTLRVERYGEITFNSSAVVPTENGLRVTGDFTLVGTTRRVTLEVRLATTGDTLRASTEFSLRQTDFGIKPYSKALGTVKVADVVRFDLSIVAIAASQAER